MTKKHREKVVAVAKDVLKQIPKLNVTTGIYLTLAPNVLQEEDEGKELQPLLPKLLNKKTKPCKVCALGACFISHVGLFDKFKLPMYSSTEITSEDFRPELRKYFGPRQLALIESAFECQECDIELGYGSYDGKKYKALKAAANWGDKYKDDTKRLRAIMRNIIKNAGEFIPA